MKISEFIIIILISLNLFFVSICNSRIMDLSRELDNSTPNVVIHCSSDEDSDN